MEEDLEKELAKAGESFSTGHLDEALSTYNDAVKRWPTNGVVRANLSALLLRVGKKEESLKEAQESVNLSPNWNKAYYRRGESELSLGDLPSAILSFSHSLSLYDNHQQSLDSLIDSSIRLFKDDFPLSTLRKCHLSQSPSAVLVCIGQSFLSQADATRAEKVLSDAYILVSPSVSIRISLLSSLSSSLSLLSFHDRSLLIAKELLLFCIENKVSQSPGLEAISREEESMGRLKEAVEYRMKIVEGMNEDDEGRCSHLLMAGHLYLSLQDHQKASHSFSSLLILTRKEEELRLARAGLAFSIALKGDTKQAISLLEDIETDCPDKTLLARIVECKWKSQLKEGLLNPHSLIQLLKDQTLDLTTVSTINSILAQFYLGNSDLRRASVHAKKCLAVCKKGRLHVQKAIALSILASIYEKSCDIPSTIALLTACANMEEGGVSERVQALHRLSILYERSHNVSESERCLRHSISISSFHPLWMSKSRSLLIRFFHRHDDVRANDELMTQKENIHENPQLRAILVEDEALIHGMNMKVDVLEESLAEAQESGNDLLEARLCLQLATVHEKEERLNESLHFYEHALTVARQLRVASVLGKAYLGLSRVLSSLQQWTRAHQMGRAAVAMARIVGEEKEEEEGMKVIARTEETRGNYGMARGVYKKMMIRSRRRKSIETSCQLLIRTASCCIHEGMIEEAKENLWEAFRQSSTVMVKIKALIDLVKCSPDDEKERIMRVVISMIVKEEKKDVIVVDLCRKLMDIPSCIQYALLCLLFTLDSTIEMISSLSDLLFLLPVTKSLPLLICVLNQLNGDSRVPLLGLLSFTSPHFVIQHKISSRLVHNLCNMQMYHEDCLDQNGLSIALEEEHQLSPLIDLLNKKREGIQRVHSAPPLIHSAVESNRIEDVHSILQEVMDIIFQLDIPLSPSLIFSLYYCTICSAIFKSNPQDILSLLDRSEYMAAGLDVPPPSSPPSLPSTSIIRLFRCENVLLHWSISSNSFTVSYCLLSLIQVPSSFEEILIHILDTRLIPRLPLPPFTHSSVVIGLPLPSLPSPPSLCKLSLSLPPLHSLLSPHCSLFLLDADDVIPEVESVRIDKSDDVCQISLARKILLSSVVVISTCSITRRGLSSSLLNSPILIPELIGDSGDLSPSLIIVLFSSFDVLDILHSLLYSFFHRGTRSVILLPNSLPPRNIEILLEEIIQNGQAVLLSFLPQEAILIGETAFSLPTAKIPRIRQLLELGCLTSTSREEREISQILQEVPSTSIECILRLQRNTRELNQIWTKLKGGEVLSWMEDGQSIQSTTQLFQLIFSDHLMSTWDELWKKEYMDEETALSFLDTVEYGEKEEIVDRRGYVSEGECKRKEEEGDTSFEGRYSVTDATRRKRKGRVKSRVRHSYAVLEYNQ